jgi:hypothetical protein
MCGQTLGMNSTYQNKKTSPYKQGSANAFFPNYRSANLATISIDFLNYIGSLSFLQGSKSLLQTYI